MGGGGGRRRLGRKERQRASVDACGQMYESFEIFVDSHKLLRIRLSLRFTEYISTNTGGRIFVKFNTRGTAVKYMSKKSIWVETGQK